MWTGDCSRQRETPWSRKSLEACSRTSTEGWSYRIANGIPSPGPLRGVLPLSEVGRLDFKRAQVPGGDPQRSGGDSLREKCNESLDAALLAWPVKVRDYLMEQGLILSEEKATLSSVYSLLSHTGGHPYMADCEQARLMRTLALVFAQFAMLRLRGSLREHRIEEENE